jgi:hypothetical protein
MRRHQFDPISMVFGATFTATGLIFLFGNVDLTRVPPAWSWPIPLMIVGALIILLSVRRGRTEPSAPEQVVPELGHGDETSETVNPPDEP